MRVSIWTFSVRVTQEGKEPELINDYIVTRQEARSAEVVQQIKKALKIPKEASMDVRLCCRHANAHMLVSELPTGTSNEELAS